MKTFTILQNLGTGLSNNASTSNTSLMGQLINDQQRYLLQKFFDNEKTVQITTVGGMSLTLTGAPIAGATSATLTAVWTYPTCEQPLTFSNGEQKLTLFTNGSAAITWITGLNNAATTAVKSVGVQSYSIPANVSKIKDNTINVGQLKYHPTPIESIQEWNNINFLPYTSDIPNYFFIYNGKFSVFPIPSTTGNIITFNYKSRVIDMTYDDYSVGTLATMTVGSTAVTGTSSLWTVFPQGVDISAQNLYLRADVATGGDGIWYPILQFNSATSLTLKLPVISTPNVTSTTTYTIGQMPLLSEDFHDMLVYGSLRIYYSAIVPDTGRYKEFDGLYKEKWELLKEYGGTKTSNLDLEDTPNQINPNLFIYSAN